MTINNFPVEIPEDLIEDARERALDRYYDCKARIIKNEWFVIDRAELALMADMLGDIRVRDVILRDLSIEDDCWISEAMFKLFSYEFAQRTLPQLSDEGHLKDAGLPVAGLGAVLFWLSWHMDDVPDSSLDLITFHQQLVLSMHQAAGGTYSMATLLDAAVKNRMPYSHAVEIFTHISYDDCRYGRKEH